MSVDVEDWFHILDLPSTPPLSAWDNLPSRVEKNFNILLELFAEKNARVTCYFLGWVAQRYPHLVKEAVAAGHEAASHGYAHQLLFSQDRKQFAADTERAKRIIEDASGQPVLGYRATGFSVDENHPWFFDVLAEVGFKYDSSIFPAHRIHGGDSSARLEPHAIMTSNGPITEFPVSVATVGPIRKCLFGGGYLRLSPTWLIKKKARAILNEGRPVVFYIHPREIDPDHPHLPMSAKRRFQSYYGLKRCHTKLSDLLETFEFTTFEQYLKDNPALEQSRL